MLRVLDLFSGIGGISLGLERAGFHTAAFCEIDPYCRRVLARHWPGVPIHDDIRQLDATRYAGTVDVVCGGYPCQPFSAAGKQQGEADPRHLWPEMRRIIRECRPRWVVCENVRGHVGLGFDTVAAHLETDGFTVWPFLVPATAVGAPHRRERLWIVAYCGELHPEGRSTWTRRRLGREGDAAGENIPDRSATDVVWDTEPSVGRVAHGVPHQLDRLAALGNAVVPAFPEAIGATIIAYEHALAA